MLINPAGFTYAGYALRDCIKALIMPTVEVHMSNIERRGMKSVTAEASVGVITGFGRDSYIYGLNAIVDLVKGKS
jgi:3-dehydroquinate dehydratase-2